MRILLVLATLSVSCNTGNVPFDIVEEDDNFVPLHLPFPSESRIAWNDHSFGGTSQTVGFRLYEGQPVVTAPADGIVNGLDDRSILIQHDRGISSQIFGISKALVQPGDFVDQGEILAEFDPEQTIEFMVKNSSGPVCPMAYFAESAKTRIKQTKGFRSGSKVCSEN